MARVREQERAEREKAGADQERRQRELSREQVAIDKTHADFRADEGRRETASSEHRAGVLAQGAAIEQDCASDRAARVERGRLAQEAVNASRARQKEAETWLTKNCKEVRLPTYERRLCDDGSAVAKWCNVQSGERIEYRCPSGAPRGVSKEGVSPVQTAEEAKVIDAQAGDYERNRRCVDVPRLSM